MSLQEYTFTGDLEALLNAIEAQFPSHVVTAEYDDPDLAITMTPDLTGPETTTLNGRVLNPWDYVTLIPHLEAHRFLKEQGGITSQGQTVSTDDRSKLMLNSLYNKAIREDDLALTHIVKFVPQLFILLTNQQIIDMYSDVTDHIQRCFDAEYATIIKIYTLDVTTPEDVETEFDTQYASLP